MVLIAVVLLRALELGGGALDAACFPRLVNDGRAAVVDGSYRIAVGVLGNSSCHAARCASVSMPEGSVPPACRRRRRTPATAGGPAPGFGVGDHPTATVGTEVSTHIVASQL